MCKLQLRYCIFAEGFPFCFYQLEADTRQGLYYGLLLSKWNPQRLMESKILSDLRITRRRKDMVHIEGERCLFKLALLAPNSISWQIPQRFGELPQGEKIRSPQQIVFPFLIVCWRHIFFFPFLSRNTKSKWCKLLLLWLWFPSLT